MEIFGCFVVVGNAYEGKIIKDPKKYYFASMVMDNNITGIESMLRLLPSLSLFPYRKDENYSTNRILPISLDDNKCEICIYKHFFSVRDKYMERVAFGTLYKDIFNDSQLVSFIEKEYSLLKKQLNVDPYMIDMRSERGGIFKDDDKTYISYWVFYKKQDEESGEIYLEEQACDGLVDIN